MQVDCEQNAQQMRADSQYKTPIKTVDQADHSADQNGFGQVSLQELVQITSLSRNALREIATKTRKGADKDKYFVLQAIEVKQFPQ